jgi:hypothetical protein
MGVSVSLHHTPVLEIITGENNIVSVGINSCPDTKCNNHLKEITNKFCFDCGAKIVVVMKQEEISKDFIRADTDLDIIEHTAYSMCFYDYDFEGYSGDCLESEYSMLADK